MSNRSLLFIVLVFSSAFALFAQIDNDSPADPESILANAEEVFRQAMDAADENPDVAKELFHRSAVLYNSLIHAGVANGAVYYNMGNAFFRAGYHGQAVLNYRRALLYTPDDPLVTANLTFLRSIQKNSFPENAQNSISDILLFWHNSITIWWKVVILVFANIVFWGSLIAGRFVKIPSWISVSAVILLLMFASSLVVEWNRLQIKHAVITEKTTIARKGDSHSYARAFDSPLYEGLEVEVLQQRVGWLQVKLTNGELCWIDARDCELVEDMAID